MTPPRFGISLQPPLRVVFLITLIFHLLISRSYAFSGYQACHSTPFRRVSQSPDRRVSLVEKSYRHNQLQLNNIYGRDRSSKQLKLSNRNDDVKKEESNHDSISVTPTNVGIAGAGAVALATATLLATRGHDPMLWSPSGAGTSELLPSNGDKEPTSPELLTSAGAIELEFQPRVASNVKQLLDSNSVVVLALPANGHVQVMDAIAPHIRSDHIIIISSHSSLGAVYLTQLLSVRGITVPIVAWGTTVATARKTSGTSVQVCTVRTLVDMCTVPDIQTNVGLEMCQNLFGDRFKLRDGLLAISLSNLNAQNHLGIALGNMSRMERGEQWSQGLNLTPNIGRLLEALDRERLDIADVLGLKVRTIYEHFQLSFHVPISSVSEMNQAMVAKGNDVNGPDRPDSRYVTEDVPFGLTLIVALGNLTGRPATLHEAGIQIVSAMYGQDFGSENGLLNALNLEDFGIEDIRKAGQTGLLTRSKEKATEI